MDQMIKYEFTGETKVEFGITLCRICALVQFGLIAKGELGGWIEDKKNLSQVSGDAWVYGDARVYGPIICASRSDGWLFVCAPRQNASPVVIAGCRYFTFTEARAHWSATRGGTQLGDESLVLVDHLERMAALQGWLTKKADAV